MQKAAADISPPGSLEKIQRRRVDFTSPTASSGTDRSASCGGYGALTERSMAGRTQETTASLYLNKCGWRRIASTRSSIVANARRFKTNPLRPAAEAEPAQIDSFTSSPFAALAVRADPIHMQQVIMNLVMNGMDAMEDEPRPRNLTIRTRRNAENDVAEVRVSDSGTGIPGDNLTRIFDAFVTTKSQGTGLGLPIARTIVESYGGTIWAENRQRGAVFCFTLPLARAS
jgi:signal transduction histidine kinase